MDQVREQLQIFVRRFGVLNAASCEECCGEQVSMVQGHILFEIRRGGTPCMQQVAEELGMDVTTFSRQAKSLEVKGLISREVSTSDRRVYRLRLTAAGVEVIRRIDLFMAVRLGMVFSCMTPFERETVTGAFTLLNEALSRSNPGKKLHDTSKY